MSLSPAPPTQYNHYVSMNDVPFIFTTADSADATARLCAITFVERQQREKPASHKTWIKFEQEQIDAVDRYSDESRYVVEWNETARVATVARSDRVRDGLIRSGYTTVSELCKFKVGAVLRFISPLKQRQFFDARAKDLAEQKASIEKARAEESLAKMLAAAPFPAPTGLPVVPSEAPLAATTTTPVAATTTTPAATTPKPPPLPAVPTFEETFKDFTQ